ncbi:MAG TPA: SGNH/GDSL hydrolase family protein [Gemmataceae bacterium]|nr:SGNH/GDSL hydrolase family protein [Gemmataceae bacterium]
MLSRQRVVPLASIVAASLLGLSATASGAESAPVTLKKSDRIVFLGDSITEAGAGPKGYITLVKKALAEKHKDLNLQVLGAGISGNKVPDLQRRLQRDVLAKKPTVVVIYIGINDVWHGEKDPARGTSKEKFEAGLKEIIGKIKDAKARVILCTPSVIGEKTAGANKLDAKLDEYANISRRVAREEKVPLCDLRKAFVDHLKKNNPDNKDRTILTSDGVHLNEAGNRFVADLMLKALGE